jgi:hypothetical protein
MISFLPALTGIAFIVAFVTVHVAEARAPRWDGLLLVTFTSTIVGMVGLVMIVGQAILYSNI